MSNQDDGKKVCKNCGETRASSKGINTDTITTLKMIPVPSDSQKKFEEALGLTAGEWSLATEVKYAKQKWTFNILLRNNLDSSKNTRIFGCTFG